MSIQRKRVKNGGDISADLEALRMEDLDTTVQNTVSSQPQMTYASTLKNPVDRYRKTMTEEFDFNDEDCTYSQGKHGQNVSFSEKVHNKLDFDWRCAVVVKLMGKPNSTNTFDFMLRGLRRKWQVKGGWQLIDLPNDFYIVKFNLEEDMKYALCGGPWILAGQTLIVRKWRPDFDPMKEFIGKMALWVRIFGLPVKFFKDFTVAKIGKILGDVVKVDKLTVGQARGQFARVCIEVDLSKPLRPFVEVESIAYQVVYEGISLICFECGCFGHAKDKCPTLKVTDNTHSKQPTMNYDEVTTHAANVETEVVDVSMQQCVPQNDVIKEDMGPWMLMSYINKKKNGDTSSTKKSSAVGSRFAVLQDETVADSELPEKTIDDNNNGQSPTIVKLWQSFQEKKKKNPKPYQREARQYPYWCLL
ncbi:uncharacterized protein LOC112198713 [Rosa chinensis]|uniref:uncharacterized protein LOC112198713 n=1 Tax=Rosa chinensis TaxID=74649 RepID=UPI000D0894A5|nr:uncharacterized protein LOC112198713 [Rosa chinensis]